MEDPKWKGQIRHSLTTLGTFLVTFGFIEQGVIDGALVVYGQIAGAVIAVMGFVKSWRAPEKSKE